MTWQYNKGLKLEVGFSYQTVFLQLRSGIQKLFSFPSYLMARMEARFSEFFVERLAHDS